jgi:hypothetical protein
MSRSTRKSFLLGLDLYRAPLNKGYSFTDCISMRGMYRQRLTDLVISLLTVTQLRSACPSRPQLQWTRGTGSPPAFRSTDTADETRYHPIYGVAVLRTCADIRLVSRTPVPTRLRAVLRE